MGADYSANLRSLNRYCLAKTHQKTSGQDDDNQKLRRALVASARPGAGVVRRWRNISAPMPVTALGGPPSRARAFKASAEVMARLQANRSDA